MQKPSLVIRKIQQEYYTLLKDLIPQEWKELEATGNDILTICKKYNPFHSETLTVPSFDGKYTSLLDHKATTIVKEVGIFWNDHYNTIREAVKNLDCLTLFSTFQFNYDPLQLFEDTVFTLTLFVLPILFS